MYRSFRILAAAAFLAGPFALSVAQAQSNNPVPNLCKSNPALCQPSPAKRQVDLRPTPPTKADLTINPNRPTPPPRR